MVKKKEEKNRVCTCCNRSLPLVRDFYKSASKLYNNRMPICKSCVNDRFKELLNYYEGDTESALMHLCYNLDVFYSEQLFYDCTAKDKANFLGEYFRRVNCEKATKNLTSANNHVGNSSSRIISVDDDFIDEKIIDFWGEGYSSKEYAKLEKKYKKYTEHYPSDTLQEQEIIRSLCELEVMKEQCVMRNDKNGMDKITTQIRKTMEDLNVLPSKMQKYGNSDKITPGQLILEVETKEPIPDKHPEFNDVDKIEWWVERYLARPIRLFFGLETGDITYKDVENDKYENNKNKRKK